MTPYKSYKTLDAWRGFAALCVVICHASSKAMDKFATDSHLENWQRMVSRLLSHSDLGVILFFVISGYCITNAVLHSSTSPFECPQRKYSAQLSFLRRRFIRIYPTYWCALLFICIFDYVQRFFTGDTLGALDILRTLDTPQILGNIFLFETYRPLFNPKATKLITEVAWSLCYEVQFYLIVGALMSCRNRLYQNLTILTGVVIVVFILQLEFDSFIFNRLFLDGTWLYFAIGIVVYYALNTSSLRYSNWISMFLSLIFLLLYLTFKYPQYPQLAFLLIGLIFGTILLILFNDDQTLAKSVYISPLMKIGKFSYSLYLIHVPICWIFAEVLFSNFKVSFYQEVLIVLPITILASLIVAKIFYILVEQRYY